MDQLELLQAHSRVAHIGLCNFDAEHARLALATGLKVVSNHVAFSLLDRRAAGAMSALCAESGLQLLAYGVRRRPLVRSSPSITQHGTTTLTASLTASLTTRVQVLAGGLLSDRFLDVAEPSPLEAAPRLRKYCRQVQATCGWPRLQQLLKTLRVIANRHEMDDGMGGRMRVSIANVATRWVLEQPAVAAVTIGLQSPGAYAVENERALQFALSAQDHREIESALTGHDGVCKGLAPLPGDCGDEYRRRPFLTASGERPTQLDGMPPAYNATLAQSQCAPPPAVPRLRIDGDSAAGFSRAVRVGGRVIVSGTGAMRTDGRPAGGADAAAQTTCALDTIEASLKALGASLDDVILTRLHVRHVRRDGDAVLRVHGLRFGALQRRPACTLVGSALANEASLVEIEAEAVVAEEQLCGARLPFWHTAQAATLEAQAVGANDEAKQRSAISDFENKFAMLKDYFRASQSHLGR